MNAVQRMLPFFKTAHPGYRYAGADRKIYIGNGKHSVVSGTERVISYELSFTLF